MKTVLKRCSCGAELTAEAWAALPLVGVMADDAETIELRNHDCGSTIAISEENHE